MLGRIYTDVHGRSDAPDFHTNRIMQSPLLVDQSDPDNMWKSKADIHLNDGVDCAAGHANCGHNQRLHLEKISGNDGLLTFLPKTPIPGAYNFTFNTLHQGAVVVNKRWNNYMANENLYPSNFEIYPRIKTVHPHVGSLRGDTLVTVTGSGFLENGLGGQVNVKIGDSDCAIESMTETQIICRTPQNTETPPSPVDVKMASFVDSSGFKLPNKGEYIHHRAKWVKTADWCKKLCAEDYACLGFSFRLDIDDGWDGCKLTSYMGGDADGEKLHIAEAVEDETVVSGWLPLASRSKETDCWTGPGELYEGQVTKTINDDECVA